MGTTQNKGRKRRLPEIERSCKTRKNQLIMILNGTNDAMDCPHLEPRPFAWNTLIEENNGN